MAQVFATCELADLSDVGGSLVCSSGWQYKEPMYPMYELDWADTATLMGLILIFFIACFSGRRLVKFLDLAASSTNGD